MEIRKDIQTQLLKAISSIGSNGATIIEIEKKVKFERHTVSKYLSLMESDGLVYHKPFGKAKVWFINNAPIQTVFNSLPEKKTFVEHVLSSIVSNLPYGLIVIDKQYNILFMNSNMTKTYGKIEDSLFYNSVLNQENPLKLKKILSVINGKVENSELEVKDKDGRILDIKASRLVHPDKDFSIVLIMDDISERKKIEKIVYDQNNLLEAERRALNSCVIVVETDLDGKITYANDQFVKLSGYKREELIGQTHSLLNSGYHDKGFFRNLWNTISKGKVWKGDIKNKSKNGSFYWTRCIISPVLGKNLKPIKYIAIRFIKNS